jgi:hypothetical protein
MEWFYIFHETQLDDPLAILLAQIVMDYLVVRLFELGFQEDWTANCYRWNYCWVLFRAFVIENVFSWFSAALFPRWVFGQFKVSRIGLD